MKNLTLALTLIFGSNFITGQSLNDKGLYVDIEGELFSGVITSSDKGIKSSLTVKDGEISGDANYYYASGQLMETGSFSHGKKDQKWVRYNEKGIVSGIAFYTLGKKSGTWLVYDEAGKKRFEMNYTDGQKTGIWTSWDENGAVADSKDYSKVN